MLQRMDMLLCATVLPLSFIIILPVWSDPPALFLSTLITSVHLHGSVVLPRGAYYTSGCQQRIHSDSVLQLTYAAVHATGIFFSKEIS